MKYGIMTKLAQKIYQIYEIIFCDYFVEELSVSCKERRIYARGFSHCFKFYSE